MENLLAEALEKNDMEGVEMLLRRAKVDVNAEMRISHYCMTPVQYCSMAGRVHLLRLLVKHGAKLHVEGEEISSMFYAAGNNRDECVKFLVAHQERETYVNDTLPVFECARYGYINTLRVLIEHGGMDVNAVDEETGDTLLHTSVKNGQREVVKYLLLATAVDESVKNKNERTAFRECSELEMVKLFDSLLEHRKEADDATDVDLKLIEHDIQMSEKQLAKFRAAAAKIEKDDTRLRELVSRYETIRETEKSAAYEEMGKLMEKKDLYLKGLLEKVDLSVKE